MNKFLFSVFTLDISLFFVAVLLTAIRMITGIW